MSTETTMELVRAYYDCWKGGSTCDEARLRKLLAPELAFEGPMGRRQGVDAYLAGISRFVPTLKAHRMLQLVALEDEAAAVYDCDLTAPVSNLRFAEFFRVAGNRIESIRLVYDATEHRKQL
jgi:SnoaL-like domain